MKRIHSREEAEGSESYLLCWAPADSGTSDSGDVQDDGAGLAIAKAMRNQAVLQLEQSLLEEQSWQLPVRARPRAAFHALAETLTHIE